VKIFAALKHRFVSICYDELSLFRVLFFSTMFICDICFSNIICLNYIYLLHLLVQYCWYDICLRYLLVEYYLPVGNFPVIFFWYSTYPRYCFCVCRVTLFISLSNIIFLRNIYLYYLYVLYYLSIRYCL
jgi:hypothetical protein